MKKLTIWGMETVWKMLNRKMPDSQRRKQFWLDLKHVVEPYNPEYMPDRE